MKILVRILFVLLVLFYLKGCLGLFYIRMTHLSKDDLEWIKPAKWDIKGKFVSDSGNVSRLSFTNFYVANSSDPFYISSASSNYYEANAGYNYEISDSKRTLKGSLEIAKLIDEDTLFAMYRFGAMFSGYDYKKIQTSFYSLNGKEFKDCLIIDSTLLSVPPAWQNETDLMIDKFIISKRYGPIYYKLKDGEEFYRKF